MNEPTFLGQWAFFDTLHTDTAGTNHRAGLLVDRQIKQRRMLTEVSPCFTQQEAVWKRIRILLEGIGKSNIRQLHSPESIEEVEGRMLLVYPLISGRSLENVLQRASSRGLPIHFDLALSLLIAISDILDIGSSIVVSGKKSFHGFLTPDNIVVAYDGTVYLKNYGIAPYLDRDDDIYTSLTSHYPEILPPEVRNRQGLGPQSDIWHLGQIAFRMLTGSSFPYHDGEDYKSLVDQADLENRVGDSTPIFVQNLHALFYRTLCPDPAGRFANVREFKDFLSQAFHMEELSSTTFNVAYFMNSLFEQDVENEESLEAEEMAYVQPEPEPEPEPMPAAPANPHLVEDILSGLDDHEKSGGMGKWLIIIAAVVAIGVVAVYFVMQNQKEQQLLAEKKQAEQTQQFEQLKKQQQEALDKIQKDLQAQKERQAVLEQEKLDMEAKMKAAQTAKEKEDLQKQIDAKNQELEAQRLEQERLQKEQDDKAQLQQAKAQQDQLNQAWAQVDQAIKAEDPAAIQSALDAAKALAPEDARVASATKAMADLQALISKVQNGETIPLSKVTVAPKRLTGDVPRSLIKKLGDKPLKAELTIDRNGKIEKVRVLSDQDASIKLDFIQTINTWTYEPATRKGAKVKTTITETISPGQ